MTVQQYTIATGLDSTTCQAQLNTGEDDKSAKAPTLGRALAHLAEAIQTAKRAGMTCPQIHNHLAVMWPVVPVEDAVDAAV